MVPRILSDESNDVTRLTVLYSRLPQGEVRRRASGRPRSGFLKKVVRRNDATGRLSAATGDLQEKLEGREPACPARPAVLKAAES